MSSSATSSQKDSWNINQEGVSFALLFSNASVLAVGCLFILQAIFIKSEKDYKQLEKNTSYNKDINI